VSKAQRLFEKPGGRCRGRGHVVAGRGCRDGRVVGRSRRGEYTVDGEQRRTYCRRLRHSRGTGRRAGGHRLSPGVGVAIALFPRRRR